MKGRPTKGGDVQLVPDRVALGVASMKGRPANGGDVEEQLTTDALAMPR